MKYQVYFVLWGTAILHDDYFLFLLNLLLVQQLTDATPYRHPAG
jgi:hypothetical protein